MSLEKAEGEASLSAMSQKVLNCLTGFQMADIACNYASLFLMLGILPNGKTHIQV